MGLLSFLQRHSGFTRKELGAILFLGTTFTLGLLLRWQEPDTPSSFDYSAEDSLFLARSRALLGEPEQANREGPPSKATPASGPVHLNHATRAELMTLPGIGGAYADRILQYRAAHGSFRSVDELERIRGIGKKTVERLRPLVTVEPPPGPEMKP